MELKYTAVILGKKDIGEVDRFYSAYTKEEGKITLLGKGTRRQGAKLSGQMETLTLSEIFVSKNRGKGAVTGALAIENFSSLKADPDSVAGIFSVFGFLEKMIPEKEKDSRLFDLLVSFLNLTEDVRRSGLSEKEKKDKFLIFRQAFFWKALDFLGYRIEISRCVSCRKKLLPEGNFFSSSRGGALCPECSRQVPGKIPASSGSIKLLRIFLANRLANAGKISVPEKDVRNLERIFFDFFRWTEN